MREGHEEKFGVRISDADVSSKIMFVYNCRRNSSVRQVNDESPLNLPAKLIISIFINTACQ